MLQLRAGVAAAVETSGAERIGTRLTATMRKGLSAQRVVFVGVLTRDGYPMCATVAGEPGLLHAPAPGQVILDWDRVTGRSMIDAPAAGDPISLLLLVLPSGGRLRINGSVEDGGAGRTRIRVAQVHVGGSKYMHLRGEHDSAAVPADPGESVARQRLSSDMSALLDAADTLLVATRHPDAQAGGKHGLDVAHRGGLPGFLSVPDAGTVTWPEYRGNGFFSTMGNLMLDPRCCLLAVDSYGKAALRVRGRAEIIWNDKDLAAVSGADRGIRLRVEEAAFVPARFAAAYPLKHYAPGLAGSTPGEAGKAPWRPMRVVDKSAETTDVVSVYLSDAEGRPLRPFRAGQHLLVRVPVGGGEAVTERSYSLSRYSRTPDRYRLTVKRRCGSSADDAGGVPSLFHDALNVGSTLLVSEPTGGFTLPEVLKRPLVFVSAGIGITPMIAMLEELAQRAPGHPLWFVHGTRSGASLAFRRELEGLKGRLPNARWHVRFSRPRPEDTLGRHYDGAGRVGLGTLKAILPFDAYDFFLCGPDQLLVDLFAGLRALNVPTSQIHLESFGITGESTAGIKPSPDNVLPVPRVIRFAKSGVSARWDPDSGTLLDVARRAGVEAPCSCRTGMCGTCSQRVLSGQVAYVRETTAEPGEGRALLCSVMPASDVDIDL